MQIIAIQILRAIAAISVSIGHAQAFIGIAAGECSAIWQYRPPKPRRERANTVLQGGNDPNRRRLYQPKNETGFWPAEKAAGFSRSGQKKTTDRARKPFSSA
jgi:hypothetical protein